MSKKDVWKNIFQKLVKNGFRSHDANTCGLHVHVSKAPIEDRNESVVDNILILVDRFWDKIVTFTRRHDEEINRWAARYDTGKDKYKNIKKGCEGERDRYMAVNLCNKATIEFRIFRGTLKIETFIATLQFVSVFVNKAIELGDNEEAVRSITWDELVKSDYEELNNYLETRDLN